MIKVNGHPISFLLDTGATYSVLREFWGPTSPSRLPIVGVGGQPYLPQQTPPLNCIFRGIPLTHTFLVVPSCPVPLMGRDLLAKVGASISFAPHMCLIPDAPAAPLLLLLATNSSDSDKSFPLPASQVDPEVWDTQNPSIARHHQPVIIQLQDPARYITRAQYPLSLESLRGLKPIISDLLRKKLLRPTSSPFNTPILAVKKSNGTYRLVQDLRLINSAVVPLHPVVPNPYTLLSSIPSGTSHFSVLDLKDAFFSIPLSPQSQNIFAFTWTDPDTHRSTQLTWTVLPQGFRDSPHLFGQALASDLLSLSLPDSKLIQYVDDILLCSPSLQVSQTNTSALLNFLCSRGYRVSPSKVQLSATQVTYLGLSITPTHKAITVDRKRLIQSLTVPSTKQEILSFLGIAGFLRSWVPSFSLLARPLYEAAQGSPHEPLLHPVTKPFQRLQQALLQAPALHLPDLTRPFSLYVAEKGGFALGALGHQLGPSFAPVAYLSKKLDLTSQGWAPCIRALAAAELLIRESKKLSFGSSITVFSHHNLSHLLTYKGLQTLPPSRVLSLQVALLEDATLTFRTCPPLNISSLLPQPNADYSPSHSCTETLEELLPHPSHIQEGTLPQATYTWYTDGSSFLYEGTRKAGYAIVSDTQVIEAQALPTHTTNQQAELIALTRAFQLAKGQSLNVYTDSKYAFHILLSHAAIWRERGLLTAKGGSISNSGQIMAMLEASHLPRAIGIVHCRSHQTDSSIISRGNNRADQAARAAALQGQVSSHPPQGIHTVQPTPSQETPDTRQILSYLHQLFHPNNLALSQFVKAHLQPTSEDLQFLRTITASCEICQKTDPNTKYRSQPFPTHQARGSLPGADWQLDFTHMPTVKKAKYLLVMVDSFSNWVEGFPVSNKRAQTVADLLLREIIPRFGVPASLQSDNGPEFTSQVSQTVAKALNISWNFHIPYRPQSSGKVERTNRSLKTILTKMSQELHLDWVRLLPLALLRLRALPKKPLSVSPFELMYGRPVLTPGLFPKPPAVPDSLLTPLLCHLRSILWSYADCSLPQPCDNPCPSPIHIGDQVLLSPPGQRPTPLSPKWQGPFKVILVTPTAAKLEGFPHWVHLSHLKPFISPPSQKNLSSYTVKQTGPLTLKLQRTSGSPALPPIPEE